MRSGTGERRLLFGVGRFSALVGSRRMVALINWLFWGVIIGGFPAIFGYIYVVVNGDSKDAIRVIARGDLLILAVVLAGGGLAQVLIAEQCPLSKSPALKAWLSGLAITVCILGVLLYTQAFNADWTGSKTFDYASVATASVVLVAGAVVTTACCLVTSLRE